MKRKRAVGEDEERPTIVKQGNGDEDSLPNDSQTNTRPRNMPKGGRNMDISYEKSKPDFMRMLRGGKDYDQQLQQQQQKKEVSLALFFNRNVQAFINKDLEDWIYCMENNE